MADQESMVYFGPEQSLVGVLHRPPAAERAVVFCAPFAEEKKCSYRTFVEAARSFARSGVACLRFDYYGTGDSAGDFREFSPDRATSDIAEAVKHARETFGVDEVTLLGLRLGGTLALTAAARGNPQGVILWQPVVSGRSFFDLTIRRQMLRKQLIGGQGGADADDGVIDLDGFPLSRAAGEQIRDLDALAAAQAISGPVRLLQISHSNAIAREYAPLAEALGARLDFDAVVCPPFWNRIDRCEADAVVRRTLAWLC